MKSIRINFSQKITDTVADAVGTAMVLQLGVGQHNSIATSHPDAKMYIGAGPPGMPGVRAVTYSPTHTQIQAKLNSNQNLIFELYATELVQDWFDFLLALYEKAVHENISNSQSYGVPSAKVKVDLSLSGGALLNQIENSAAKDFGHLPAKEKLRIVSAALNKSITTQNVHIDIVRTNIKVRNILQHAGGIVSQEDLDELGVNSLTEDHGNTQKSISVGQRISRTAFDLENFVNSMISIANVLAP